MVVAVIYIWLGFLHLLLYMFFISYHFELSHLVLREASYNVCICILIYCV